MNDGSTDNTAGVAAKAGADFVKVFPCGQVGGPGYINALKAPFPDLRFIMLHVMKETACHAGHLDAVRELIDGRQWIVMS